MPFNLMINVEGALSSAEASLSRMEAGEGKKKPPQRTYYFPIPLRKLQQSPSVLLKEDILEHFLLICDYHMVGYCL